MSARIVTPAEAQALLAPNAIAHLRAAAFDLAVTVESEPERIAATAAAERAAIVAQLRKWAQEQRESAPMLADFGHYADALLAAADTLASEVTP